MIEVDCTATGNENILFDTKQKIRTCISGSLFDQHYQQYHGNDEKNAGDHWDSGECTIVVYKPMQYVITTVETGDLFRRPVMQCVISIITGSPNLL